MKDLNYPAKPLFRNESHVDVTIFSNEESEVEDYHTQKTYLTNFSPQILRTFQTRFIKLASRYKDTYYVRIGVTSEQKVSGWICFNHNRYPDGH